MIFGVASILILFLIFPLDISLCARDTLLMCFSSVIPSLFPFMALSKMLVSSGRIKEDNFLFRIIGRIFKISDAGVWAFGLGLVCGYPVGAKIICELLDKNRISKREAQRLMLFSNNAGPAFVIATVGGMFFSDVKTGVIIYLSHIFSSLIIAYILSFFPVPVAIRKNSQAIRPPFAKVFISSVTDSVSSVLNVTGIIVFFSVLIKGLDIIKITAFMPEAFSGIFKGMLEMTTGIKILAASDFPYNLKVILSTFLVSFSGASVFFQMGSFSDEINIRPCVIAKLFGGILSMVICYLFLISQ